MPASDPKRDLIPVSEATLAYANRQLEAGVSPVHVVELLVEQGLTSEQAKKIAYSRSAGRNETAMVSMLIGAVVCGVGIAITVGTQSAAAASGGGPYVIAWGAILFGGIAFVRGLYQLFGD